MYIIIILLLACWLAYVYAYSGQLLKKSGNKKIKRDKIFFISVMATPLISLTIHFLFIFVYDSHVIDIEDWIFIIDSLICFVLVPIFTPKIIFFFLKMIV